MGFTFDGYEQPATEARTITVQDVYGALAELPFGVAAHFRVDTFRVPTIDEWYLLPDGKNIRVCHDQCCEPRLILVESESPEYLRMKAFNDAVDTAMHHIRQAQHFIEEAVDKAHEGSDDRYEESAESLETELYRLPSVLKYVL